MGNKIVIDVEQKLQSHDFRKLIKVVSSADKDALDWLLNHAKINQNESELSGGGSGEVLGDYLCGAFDWCDSPQAEGFWRKIAIENKGDVW